MRLRWLPLALQDIDRIRRYIALDNPKVARRWVERLRHRAKAAATAPMTGRVVPELERDDVREVFLRTYRVVYLVMADEIRVLTVFEGHRLLSPDVVPPKEGL